MSTTGPPSPDRPSHPAGAVPDGRLIRVPRGRPGAAGPAAPTAVVLARAAGAGAPAGPAPTAPVPAGRRRPERTRGFPGPRTWRTGPRPGPAR
ncbi:acyl-CoA carboxylase epsilon subunit [Streptomyces sp. NPDC038707]|uniref:acyl-CoA carboxylase epsilon subunit n=1 Tax=Streptomyces sp. NPDC038707 TaxID=3154329 RepID=UPI0033F3AC36